MPRSLHTLSFHTAGSAAEFAPAPPPTRAVPSASAFTTAVSLAGNRHLPYNLWDLRCGCGPPLEHYVARDWVRWCLVLRFAVLNGILPVFADS